MIASFTGTRNGMSPQQWSTVHRLLAQGVKVLHHGDAIGADAQAHETARHLGIFIVVHPPTNPRYRAFCIGDVVLEPADYGVRDRDLVDEGDFLIAGPFMPTEERRSGTWQTVRYARKIGRRIIIVDPLTGVARRD